jgi:hypothetical protein
MTTLRLRGLSRTLGLSPSRRAAVGAAPPDDAEAPSVPQNLSATAISDSQIDLTWDASTDNVGVTGYKIFRDNALVDTSPTNAYADTGLNPGTEYEYEVSAFDAAANESARSAPDSATTPQVIVAEGLVAEWRFDEGAGQVLTDHAGGHHGQLGGTAGADANDPTWTAQGLSFDGSNDYVYTTDWAFPSPQFHVDIVGYFASTGGGTDFVVVFGTTRTGAGDDDTSPLILFREGATASLRIRIGDGATNVLSSPGGTVFDDAWHHLSIDYDGSQLTVEVDGTVAISQTIGLTPNTITASTLFGIWHNLALLPATMTLGYVTAYDGTFSSGQKAQQAAALAAIMAGRGVALP